MTETDTRSTTETDTRGGALGGQLGSDTPTGHHLPRR